jgi:hypothetical protein
MGLSPGIIFYSSGLQPGVRENILALIKNETQEPLEP